MVSLRLHRSAVVVCLFCLAALVGGCAGGRPGEMDSPGELLERGEELLARGKYRQAQTVFTRFLDLHPSDPAAGEAQLGLARSLMGVKEWELAREELNTVLARYAGTPFVEEARYLMGTAYARESLPAELDQDLTRRALEEFEAYLADFPRGAHRPEVEAEKARLRQKLAHKQNLNGFLYLKMGFPEAARIYFETVLAKYADTDETARARFGLAETLRSMGRSEEAEAIYRELLEGGLSGDLKEECEKRLRESETRPAESPRG